MQMKLHQLPRATENVPEIDGKDYVFPDISGSMHSAVTGCRKGATSMVRCLDVAALVASVILRKNPTAEIIPTIFGECRSGLHR